MTDLTMLVGSLTLGGRARYSLGAFGTGSYHRAISIESDADGKALTRTTKHGRTSTAATVAKNCSFVSGRECATGRVPTRAPSYYCIQQTPAAPEVRKVGQPAGSEPASLPDQGVSDAPQDQSQWIPPDLG